MEIIAEGLQFPEYGAQNWHGDCKLSKRSPGERSDTGITSRISLRSCGLQICS